MLRLSSGGMLLPPWLDGPQMCASGLGCTLGPDGGTVTTRGHMHRLLNGHGDAAALSPVTPSE